MGQGYCDHSPTWLPQTLSTAPSFFLLNDLAVHCWSTPADMMEEDLMFSMEEEEGSANRPSVHRRGASQRTCSFTKSSTSDDDDDDEDHVIRPILEDSAKEICHYLTDLVTTRQLSNSLPKGSFTYRVSFWRARRGRTDGQGQTAVFHLSVPRHHRRSHYENGVHAPCLWSAASALLFVKNRK